MNTLRQSKYGIEYHNIENTGSVCRNSTTPEFSEEKFDLLYLWLLAYPQDKDILNILRMMCKKK